MKPAMKLLGVGGTNGSGKDTLGETLASDFSWLFVSVTDILRDEVVRRGLAVERENLRAVGNEWRKQFGPGVLIDKAVEIYQRGNYPGLVVASLRAVGEVEHLHNLSGKMVWVDADPKVRYERINSRKRGTEDQKTFEQFLAEEAAEMRGSADKATLNMAGVKAMADIFITNDTSELDQFKAAVKRALKNCL